MEALKTPSRVCVGRATWKRKDNFKVRKNTGKGDPSGQPHRRHWPRDPLEDDPQENTPWENSGEIVLCLNIFWKVTDVRPSAGYDGLTSPLDSHFQRWARSWNSVPPELKEEDCYKRLFYSLTHCYWQTPQMTKQWLSTCLWLEKW